MSVPVKLYVYDLSNGMARQLSEQLTGRLIEGIWHTSVVVFGKETFYGQGISITPPGRSHHGNPHRVIDMGETSIDEQTFNDYLEDMREHYTADKYHLLDFNCNSFTNDCIGFLTGNSIPDFIKDLPADFLSTPFGAALRPTIDNMYRRPTPGATPPVAATPPPARPNDLGENPQLTASLLQAVAAQAQASPSAANTGTPATQSLTAPLHICTNLPSFRNLLQSHRVVVAFFTSATCQPCRMIEPVYERLGAEKSTRGFSQRPVFTKTDLGSASASSLASEYGVRVTPTFLFFLDGKKTHELKGADAGELRTQIDLLLYEAYPPHPHSSLSLPAVRAISFNPILFQQVPPLDTVGAKLVGFIDDHPESDYPTSSPRLVVKQSITASLIPHLKVIQSASSASQKPAATPIPLLTTSAQTTKILFGILAPTSLFPLVDLWRLLVLQSNVSSWALAQLSQPASILELLLDKAAAIFLDGQAQSAPKPFVLTTLRLLCNMFSNPTSRILISTPKWRLKLTTLVVSALLSEDTAVRTAAASLAFNISAIIQKQRVDATNNVSSAGPLTTDPEWEIELVSVVLESIDREKGSEEVVHRLLATLAFLIRFSPSYETDLSPLLSILQARSTLERKLAAGGCGEKGVGKKDVVKLVKEVATLLCPADSD